MKTLLLSVGVPLLLCCGSVGVFADDETTTTKTIFEANTSVQLYKKSNPDSSQFVVSYVYPTLSEFNGFLIAVAEARYGSYEDNFAGEVVATYSADQGATWKTIVAIPRKTTNPHSRSINPTVFHDNNNLFLVAETFNGKTNNWKDYKSGDGDFVYSSLNVVTTEKETDARASLTFSEPVSLLTESFLNEMNRLKRTRLIGGFGRGIEVNGTAIVPVWFFVNKKEGFATVLLSDSLNWKLSQGTGDSGTLESAVVEWEGKLIMNARINCGYRKVYESTDMGNTWKEALGSLSRVWGNAPNRQGYGCSASFITVTIENTSVMLFTNPLSTQNLLNRYELHLWVTDNKRIYDVGQISGNNRNTGHSSLLYTNGSLYCLYEDAAKDTRYYNSVLANLVDELKKIKEIIQKWKKQDNAFSEPCDEKDPNPSYPGSACEVHLPQNGLVGFLSNEAKTDKWKDAYGCVDAKITHGEKVTNGIKFKESGAGAMWPVGRQGQNQRYHFMNHEFTLAATMIIHECNNSSSTPLLSVVLDTTNKTKLMEIECTNNGKLSFLKGAKKNEQLSFSKNKPIRVVFTFQGGITKLYIDGKLINEKKHTFTSGLLRIPISHICILQCESSSTKQDTGVTVKNVLLYNRVLQAEEIRLLYLSIVPTRTPTISKTNSLSKTLSTTKTSSYSLSHTTTQSLSQSTSKSHSLSHTGTLSQSLSHTGTESESLSHTGTLSQSLSHTASDSHSLSHTGTLSQSLSHTASDSHSLSHTGTQSQSLSHTGTLSQSLSHTASDSHSLSHTGTQSQSLSHTGTLSQSLSHTASDSHSLSHTGTQSQSLSHTGTLSQSLSHTASDSHSLSHTGTQSQSLSHTGTLSQSLSHTASDSHSLSHTGTQSQSLSHTGTLSQSLSHAASDSKSLSHTGTLSQSLSHTASDSHSLSHTGTLSQSLSHTGTQSQSLSHTGTLSQSLSHTASDSHSLSHTGTQSQSLSHTGTLSQSLSHAASDSKSLSHTGTLSQSLSHKASDSKSLSHTGTLSQSLSHISDSGCPLIIVKLFPAGFLTQKDIDGSNNGKRLLLVSLPKQLNWPINDSFSSLISFSGGSRANHLNGFSGKWGEMLRNVTWRRNATNHFSVLKAEIPTCSDYNIESNEEIVISVDSRAFSVDCQGPLRGSFTIHAENTSKIVKTSTVVNSVIAGMTAVTIFGAGGVGSILEIQALSLLSRMNCARKDERYGFNLLPYFTSTFVHLGSLWIVLGNALIVVIFGSIHYCITVLYKRRRGVDSSTAWSRMFFPSFTYFVAYIMHIGIFVHSVSMLFIIKAEWHHYFVGIAGTSYGLIFPLFVLYCVTHYIEVQFVSYQHFISKSCLKRFFVPIGFWAPRHQAKMYGNIFFTMRGAPISWCVFHLSVVCIAGIVTVIPTSTKNCHLQYFCLMGIFLFGSIVTAVANMMRSVFLTSMHTLSFFLLGTLCCISGLNYVLTNKWFFNAYFLLIVFLLIVVFIISIYNAILVFYEWMNEKNYAINCMAMKEPYTQEKCKKDDTGGNTLPYGKENSFSSLPCEKVSEIRNEPLSD